MKKLLPTAVAQMALEAAVPLSLREEISAKASKIGRKRRRKYRFMEEDVHSAIFEKFNELIIPL